MVEDMKSRKLPQLLLILGVFIISADLCAEVPENLEVQVLTRPGVQPSSTFPFSKYADATATVDAPWIMCDQCFLVIHTPSDEVYQGTSPAWHIRFVTANKELPGMTSMKGKPLGKGPDGQWGVAGVDDNGNMVTI